MIKQVMGGDLRLSDLGRPLQDDLGKDTHKKNDLVSKILKKKKGNSCGRKGLLLEKEQGQCSWTLVGRRKRSLR